MTPYILPESYRIFLKENLIPSINALTLLVDEGNAERPSELSIQHGSNLLRRHRLDLAESYVPIRIIDDYALCFHKAKDDELFEIHLGDASPPISLRLSFLDYISYSQAKSIFAKTQLDYLIRRYGQSKYDRSSGKRRANSRILRGNKTPKIIRSCIHDRVVGIARYELNRHKLRIDVSAFMSSDHPNYEEWNGLKSTLTLLFCEAYKSSYPPTLRFKFSDRGRNKLPSAVVDFARRSKIELSEGAEDGRLCADDTLEIVSRLQGLSENIYSLLSGNPNLSPGGICFLISNDIWSPLEISYLLSSSNLAHRILSGKQAIEDNPILHNDLIGLARNAAVSQKFVDRVRRNPREFETEGWNDLRVDMEHLSFAIKLVFSGEVICPWVPEEFEDFNSATKALCLVPRHRRILPDEKNKVLQDIEEVSVLAGDPTVILYGEDHLHWLRRLAQNNPAEMEEIKQRLMNKYVQIACAPFETVELDDEILNRMERCKHVRL